MTTERKHIGEVYVDAGLIWIGDPCYFWQKEDDLTSTAVEAQIGTWQEFCNKINATPYPHRYNFNGLGVAVTSGLGDGIYPIYAEIENGAIKSVTIEFFSDDEEEDEDEDEEDEEPVEE